MAESTWSRDVRVMEVVRDLERDKPGEGQRDDIVGRLPFTKAEINDALRGLIEGGYVIGRDGGTMAERFDWWDLRLTEKGRRAIQQWPSDDPGAALVQLLEERLEQSEDPSETTKLQRVLDTIRDVGTGVLSSVLRDLLRGAGI